MIKFIIKRLLIVFIISLLCIEVSFSAISQRPLFLAQDVAPIVLLTMGRDHKLYYEAYNDASDLDGDGELDIKYKPASIDYYGYFDSYKCYKYDNSKRIFEPTVVSSNKKCSGEWSGDILNYLTTSRMDAIRKVLYGGYRSEDSTSETILERVYIPQDAHSWGKEYNSIAVDGYAITDYTPLAMPTSGTRHLFASTTLLSSGTPGTPILRRLENQTIRIWEWVSKNAPVVVGAAGMIGSPTDFITKVKVCVSGMLEDNCKAYSDGTTVTYKPTGLLQKYGDDDTMAFGLLTGSFKNNLQGGVIRKNISSFTDEIDQNTGIFSSMNGIVKTIDKLRIYGFNGSHDGGWISNRPIKNGEANPWGNPVSEMMYEGLRYFAGKSGPTTVFADGVNLSYSIDTKLGLPLPAWQDPYRTSGGYEYCAKPVQLVISDINPSYDTDSVPGSSFNAFSGDLTALDVSKLADFIWDYEYDSKPSLIFIGESNGVKDGAPTAKQVTSFKNIRGLSPEEPTKMGGYYSGSVAYYGNQTDLNPAQDDQKVDLFAVALASPLPRIEIPVNGQKVTIVPFAKSVYWSDAPFIFPGINSFQPTDQIVDFYVVKIANTAPGNKDSSINSGRPYGEFIINFEDVEQGADHDMDAFVEYKFEVNAANEVVVEMNLVFAGGGIIQHMGYIISGTTADGIYLEIRDEVSAGGDKDFFLDTPPNQLPGGTWNDGIDLPQTTSRKFTPSTSASSGSYLKHDPLWYAAKWGGFREESEVARRPTNAAAPNFKPDQDYEWDSNKDGDPDNYFLVTNAGLLEKQLNKALVEILSRTSSSAAVATNTTRLDSTTKVYQARFDSENWTGEFLGFAIKSDGSIGAQAWNAANEIFINSTTSSTRKVFSFDRTDANGNGTGVKGIEFNWSELNPLQQASLNRNGKGIPDAAGAEKGSDRLDYIRGDKINEGTGVNDFRVRVSDLGDVINSDPWFVGKHEDFGYNILAAPEGSTYDAFRILNRGTPGTPAVPGRTSAVYFGANDGMLHAIDADTGEELFTYVPNEVIASLPKLSSPLYGCTGQGCIPHQYYVDGSVKSADTYFSSDSAWHTVLIGSLGAGGKAIFSLDVTEPTAFDETKILWEISNTQAFDATDLAEFQANLGYTLPQASIVRLNNGAWAAVVANGYNSVNQKAVLYLIDIETGQILKTLDTGIGSGAAPNGLSTPIVIDINGDKTADIVYAGDLLGNLWKFDLSDANDAQWGVAYSTGNVLEPLYKACTNTSTPCADTQPITSKPQVGRHSMGGLMVYFGTGKYFEENDQIVGNTPQIQTFYGIRDNGAPVSGMNALQEQKVLAEATLTFKANTTTTPPIPAFDIDVRVTSDCETDYAGTAAVDCDGATISTPVAKEGWFMKLLSPVVNSGNGEGERVVSAPLLRGGRVIFVTITPESDACSAGGTSWLMEFDAESGGRLETSPFDVDGDGTFSITDFVKIYDSNGDGKVDGNDADKIPVTGVRKRTMGMFKTPGVVVCEDGKECKYTSGTSGKLDMITESSGNPTGRQSWNQIK